MDNLLILYNFWKTSAPLKLTLFLYINSRIVYLDYIFKLQDKILFFCILYFINNKDVYNKVFMDFAFFAIAFNIKKMCAKMTKEGMDWLIRPFYELTVVLFRCCERINQRNPQNIAA